MRFPFSDEHVRSEPSCPILMTVRPFPPLGVRTVTSEYRCRQWPRGCLVACDVISDTTERPRPRGDFAAAARSTPTDSAIPVAMSLTSGTLSGQAHTHRSITSAWDVTVMVSPQPCISGAAVCIPTTLAPAQYVGPGLPDAKATMPWHLGARDRARPSPV